jgi:hypothetical protein
MLWGVGALVLGGGAVLLGGCAVSVDSNPRVIPDAALPEALVTDTTSEAVDHGVPTEERVIYLVDDTQDFGLRVVEADIPVPVNLGSIVGVLREYNPSGKERAQGLTNLLRGNMAPPRVVGQTTPGQVTVELDELPSLNTRDLSRAAGQLVLTITETDNDLKVTIVVDGEPQAIRVPAGGERTELTRADFEDVKVSSTPQTTEPSG